MSKNSIISPFLVRSPPQELEVGPRSGPYLLVSGQNKAASPELKSAKWRRLIDRRQLLHLESNPLAALKQENHKAILTAEFNRGPWPGPGRGPDHCQAGLLWCHPILDLNCKLLAGCSACCGPPPPFGLAGGRSQTLCW